MAMFPWTLRRYRNGDEHSIVKLLNTVFGRRHSPEYWRWKYAKNPAGSPIVWLAECNNEIVGHYSIIPVAMKVGNAYVTGSFSADAATHPDYQGQGVFSSIANRLYIDAAESDIPITYGYANTRLGPTYKRYERMGHICFMVPMVRVLDWKAFLARCLNHEFPMTPAATLLQRIHRPRPTRDHLAIEQINHFDERIDELWKRISPSFKILLRRDRTYLNWRYTNNPERQYAIYAAVENNEILGYCVLAQRQWQGLRLGIIADLFGFLEYRNAIGRLIGDALNYSERHGVHAVLTRLSEQHPYRMAFMKAGFVPTPHRDLALYSAVNLRGCPIDISEAYSQALTLSQNPLLKKKSNWFMMYGDCDII